MHVSAIIGRKPTTAEGAFETGSPNGRYCHNNKRIWKNRVFNKADSVLQNIIKTNQIKYKTEQKGYICHHL